MKYIKQYESIREDIKRGDLIMYEEDRHSKSHVYLVLKDLPRNKRKIDIYCIGYFQYESFSTLNEDEVRFGAGTIYKMDDVRLLDENEKLKIAVHIYQYKYNKYFEERINTIKEETGIDLREMPEYIEYADKIEMEKNAKKYNI